MIRVQAWIMSEANQSPTTSMAAWRSAIAAATLAFLSAPLLSHSPAGPANRDSIVGGFSHGFDRNNLATIDANVLAGGNQAFSFKGTAAFSGKAGELRYSAYGNVCLVDGDINGDKLADSQVAVNGTHWMTGTDFVSNSEVGCPGQGFCQGLLLLVFCVIYAIQGQGLGFHVFTKLGDGFLNPSPSFLSRVILPEEERAGESNGNSDDVFSRRRLS